MSTGVRGCPTCWNDRPAAIVAEHPDGSRTLSETCPACGFVWGLKHLTLGQVIAQETTKSLSEILWRLADAIAGNRGADAYRAIVEEIAIRYGEEAEDAILAFMSTVADVEKASHTDAAEASQTQEPRQ